MNTYQGERQLDALGDPTRRRILMLLSIEGPLPVVRMAEHLPVSRPAVSQHLKILHGAGLVQMQAEGTKRLYSLDDSGLADVHAFFSTYWRHDLSDYARFVKATLEQES